MKTYQNYINGIFVEGYENIEVLNPATGQPFAFQAIANSQQVNDAVQACLLYTSPSPRDLSTSRMPSSA